MGEIIIPQGYKSALNLHDTQVAIKTVKDYFQHELTHRLHLLRVTAPLFVQPETGLNDNLNGVEHPVSFELKDQGTKKTAEIVQSLAKWKRYALHKYGFSEGEGIYTDMNAIRQDEVTDNIHSVYVDQWDWEKIIRPDQRNYTYLKTVVRAVYLAVRRIAAQVTKKYPALTFDLPREITFVSTKELEKMYPALTPRERENAFTKTYRAVFVYQIGWPLANKQPHDGRAADYDDWKLNGDILLWHEPLDCALEISSMGIRVNAAVLEKQLRQKKELDKLSNPYCRAVMNGELPLTVGGGIGQSRLCMFFLKKRHIGEVQASVWSAEEEAAAEREGLALL